MILKRPNIKKIFNEEKINKKDIIILSLSVKNNSEIKKPPDDIIVNAKVNFSNIRNSVKFKKNNEIKNNIPNA